MTDYGREAGVRLYGEPHRGRRLGNRTSEFSNQNGWSYLIYYLTCFLSYTCPIKQQQSSGSFLLAILRLLTQSPLSTIRGRYIRCYKTILIIRRIVSNKKKTDLSYPQWSAVTQECWMMTYSRHSGQRSSLLCCQGYLKGRCPTYQVCRTFVRAACALFTLRLFSTWVTSLSIFGQKNKNSNFSNAPTVTRLRYINVISENKARIRKLIPLVTLLTCIYFVQNGCAERWMYTGRQPRRRRSDLDVVS